MILRYFIEIYPQRSSGPGIFYDVRHPLLDAEITFEEVRQVLRKIAKDKTPGLVVINNDFYAGLPNCWVKYITDIFNLALDLALKHGYVPEDWCSSLVTLIYKKGNHLDPINYRDIALMNCITKIFTTLLFRRLIKWSEINKIIPESQCGFRPGRSCDDVLFSLQAKIAIALAKQGGKLYAVMIDSKRAFDSVDHNILWETLYIVGISAQMIRVLQSLYNRASMKVQIDNFNNTNTIDVTEGVLQGDPLSPLLFSMFISDIE